MAKKINHYYQPDYYNVTIGDLRKMLSHFDDSVEITFLDDQEKYKYQINSLFMRSDYSVDLNNASSTPLYTSKLIIKLC